MQIYKLISLVFFVSIRVFANQLDQDNISIIDLQKEINLDPNAEIHKRNQLQLGLGAGYGIVPHYPASNQSSSKSIVLPIIIYRGDILKSDQEEGTRAELFRSSELDINLSFGARFSNDSKDNIARTGMPNLNYILEIGPSLNYKIFRERHKKLLTFQVPLRFTTETDFKKYNYLGLVFQPEIKFQMFNLFVENLKYTSSISFEFFSDRVANYFYEVEPQYANSDRTQYKAQSGFSHVTVGQSVTYDFNQFKVIAGVNFNNYSYSTSKNSPLFKNQNDSSVFTAIAWFFYSKDQAVD